MTGLSKKAENGFVDGRILVADAEPDVRRLIEGNLTRAGYKNLLFVADGEETIKAVGEQKPDLIILGVMMPKKDGFAVLQELKNSPKTRFIPAIMLTGKTQDSDILKGWQYGADIYLFKPFDPAVLVTVVARIFDFLTDQRARHFYENTSTT